MFVYQGTFDASQKGLMLEA
ncbi:hypothetical protein [Acidovorax sp. BL-A-41-H1]